VIQRRRLTDIHNGTQPYSTTDNWGASASQVPLTAAEIVGETADSPMSSTEPCSPTNNSRHPPPLDLGARRGRASDSCFADGF
jgi:hypothetical protein